MADRNDQCSWDELPPADAADEQWSEFKARAFDELCELVKEADRQFGSDPQARLERIRVLRREHHLIVAADRLRRSGTVPAELSGAQLREAAAYVVDRGAYANDGRAEPRSRFEEKIIGSARVNWHKIMRRAQSRAGPQGGWGPGRRELRGSVQIFRKITAPGLSRERRATLLREHIEERLQQLVDLVREVSTATGSELPRQDRILVHDLELALYRSQWAKRKKGTQPAER